MRMVRGLMRVLIAGNACVLLGATGAISFAFLLSPATSREASPWVNVTTLASVPADGLPRRHALYAVQRDSWARLPDRPLGCVYLRRMADSQEVVALRAITPFGTLVEFDRQTNSFREPCWGMKYDLSGNCLNRPSHPGDLERLPVEVRGGEVFVKDSPQQLRWKH